MSHHAVRAQGPIRMDEYGQRTPGSLASQTWKNKISAAIGCGRNPFHQSPEEACWGGAK